MAKLYTDLADEWYELLTPVEEYREEADLYRRMLQEANPGIKSVLELGCGAGHNAFYLKASYEMTLTDLSKRMLNVSKRVNPECTHVEGDMRSLELGRKFDAVFVHDAISHINTKEDMRRVVRTAAAHLLDGGVLLIAPDAVKERFEEGYEHGGTNGPKKAIRYLEWSWDPDPNDDQMTVDYVYMMREEDGTMRVVTDRFVEGLFSEEDWKGFFEAEGFDVRAVEDEANDRVLFVGVKRS